MRSCNLNRYPDADYHEGDQGDYREKSSKEITRAWDRFSDEEVEQALLNETGIW